MEKWRFPAIRLEIIGSATSHLVRKSPELYVKELFYLSSHTMLYSIAVNSYNTFCKKSKKVSGFTMVGTIKIILFYITLDT